MSYVKFPSKSKREYNLPDVLPAAHGAVQADHDYHIDFYDGVIMESKLSRNPLSRKHAYC